MKVTAPPHSKTGRVQFERLENELRLANQIWVDNVETGLIVTLDNMEEVLKPEPLEED